MHSNGTPVATPLQRVTERARRHPTERMHNLLHLVKVEMLTACFHALRQDAAAGVDGVTAAQYAVDLPARLHDLEHRLHAMQYRPQPVRRVYIPKGDGDRRPLGIPALEDKIVQEAFRRILEAIFEGDFLDTSYGFRPGRSCHMALQALDAVLMRQPVNFVIDADIKGFFDSVDHGHLLRCLETRISDPRFLRYVARFLKAGVLEEGVVSATEQGTPQGGVVSPVLSNIYLHYALDLWIAREVAPRARGVVYLNRYADDFVLAVQHADEAERLLADLGTRLAACGLTLSPQKTRLLAFGRYAEEQSRRSGIPTGTFDYLGFTHYMGRSRRGRPIVGRRTSRTKLVQKLAAVKTWLCQARHWMSLPDLWRGLIARMRGHDAYYGIGGNSRQLRAFHREVTRLVFVCLTRSSQRRRWTWAEFRAYLTRYPLPPPRLTTWRYVASSP
jgi:RNA-directed DNA polymerase